LPSCCTTAKSLSKELDPMDLEELTGRYRNLRTELDAAYAAPVWDSNRINRITEEMMPVELALASFECERSIESGGSHV
jgi:hypothetical protein